MKDKNIVSHFSRLEAIHIKSGLVTIFMIRRLKSLLDKRSPPSRAPERGRLGWNKGGI
jgi:hypothetical protein